ncbi:unnamed protein product [Trichobilharzia regenti]|nr:unnamed protein product [Trichobilharzia regenti]
MVHKKRPKSVRKARAASLALQEKLYTKTPHTMIFSRPGVGSLVKQLALDFREIFEPFTASRLRVTRQNVLKDFITIAGPLNVTHLMYLTHPQEDKRKQKRTRRLTKVASKQLTDDNNDRNMNTDEKSIASVNMAAGDSGSSDVGGGGVYLHMIRVPHGPSLTFRVSEYSLKRDVLTLVRRIFDCRQYSTPPLLVMTGFGMGGVNANTSAPLPHLRLVVDMFQNLLPPLNVPKLKLSTVKRVLLVSREVDTSSQNEGNTKQLNDVIYIRHYHIRTENRCISRALRRLGMGGAKLKRRRLADPQSNYGIGPSGSGKSTGVPNLAKYSSMDDYLTNFELLSIGFSLMRKRGRTTGPIHGLKHLGTAKKATLRLTEIGPRLTLNLIKVCSLLLTELVVQSERLRQREAIRAKRRAEHEARRAANEADREAHRAACLEGMKRAGQLPLRDKQLSQEATDVNGDVSSETSPLTSQPEQAKKNKKVKFNETLITDPKKSITKRAFKSKQPTINYH